MRRQDDAQLLSVFQAYVYWSAPASYERPEVDDVATDAPVTALDAQLMELELGEPGARIARPLLPCRLNFTGIACPEFAELSAAFETGEKPKTVVRWEKGTVFQNAATDALLRLVRDLPGAAEYLAARRGVALSTIASSEAVLER